MDFLQTCGEYSNYKRNRIDILLYHYRFNPKIASIYVFILFQCLSNKRRNVIPDSHVSNKQNGQVIYDTMTTKEEFQMRNRTILRRPNESQNSKDENRCRVHDPEAYMQDTKYERVSPLSSYLTENHYENLMPLQERRSCIESRDCQARSQYKWSLTGWSSCLPTNVNADSSCGEGVRR